MSCALLRIRERHGCPPSPHKSPSSTSSRFAWLRKPAPSSRHGWRRVGNYNKLAYMREQVFYADATAQLARARLTAIVERERLSRLLGLQRPHLTFAIPDRLPELPGSPLEAQNAEQTALDRRLDVQLARQSTAAVASDLGLTRATRFINVLEAGYTNESARRANGGRTVTKSRSRSRSSTGAMRGSSAPSRSTCKACIALRKLR